MVDPSKLKRELDQFHGSETIYKFSPNAFLTEGTKYLADSAEAYWLMDLILSHQINPKVRREPFQVWRLTKDSEEEGDVVMDDGNNNVITRQHLWFTDFPLPHIKLYAGHDGSRFLIWLPSEN